MACLIDEAGGVKASARDVAQWVQLVQTLINSFACAASRYSARATAVRAICADVSGAGLGNAGLPGDINSSDSRDRA